MENTHRKPTGKFTQPRTLQQMLALIVAMAVFSVALYTGNALYKQEQSRRWAIDRLTLEPRTSWDEVQHHIDCELVPSQASVEQLREKVTTLGAYQEWNQLSDDSRSGRVIIAFRELSALEYRIYNFEAGHLASVERLEDVMEGTHSTVVCP